MTLSEETERIYHEFVRSGLGGTITSRFDPDKEIFFIEWTHGPYGINPLESTTIHSHKEIPIFDLIKDDFLKDFIPAWIKEIRDFLEQLKLQTKLNS